MTGNVRSPGGGASFSFDAAGDGSGTSFAARVTVPVRAEAGNWYVSNLFIADRVDNTLVTGFTPGNVPAGGRLTVVSSEPDTTPPNVIHVDVENGSVRGGETNHVRIEIQDDRSGVAAVTGGFQSPSRTAGMSFTAHREGDSDNWVADIAVAANADCGEWRMQQLRFADRAGNGASLGADSPLISRASFSVMTDMCDSQAPTVDSLLLSPTSVSNEAASVITVTATVSDDASGVSTVTGWVSGPPSTSGDTPKLSFGCTKSPADPNSPWTGRISVPQFAARGTWRMGRLKVTDRAGNSREYMPSDSLMEGATFEVQ